MRFTVIAVGTRGDVQPLVALAKGLCGSGHTVCVATTHEFSLLVQEHGWEYVGFTQVMRSGEQTLYQHLTGVRREYRRQGIALALKLRSIAHAKATQIETIITNNDPSSSSMLVLNERLGFMRQPDQLFFRKELRKQNLFITA